MNIFAAFFLGLVQGITEFLPISSSGHLSILQNVFNLQYSESENLLFDVMLHLGTLISVYLVYKKNIKRIVGDTLTVLMGRNEDDGTGRPPYSVRTAFFVVIATIPMAFLLPIYSKIKALYGNLAFIAFSLIVSGALLYASGKLEEGKKNEKTSTVRDIFLIGLAQMVAIIPGLSRSGATISVGLARGFKKEYAVEFSFLLSIPPVLGSVVVSLFDAIKAGINWSAIPAYIVGMTVAAISGYYAIISVRKLLKRDKLGKLSYYCWGLGVIALIASLFV